MIFESTSSNRWVGALDQNYIMTIASLKLVIQTWKVKMIRLPDSSFCVSPRNPIKLKCKFFCSFNFLLPSAPGETVSIFLHLKAVFVWVFFGISEQQVATFYLNACCVVPKIFKIQFRAYQINSRKFSLLIQLYDGCNFGRNAECNTKLVE